MAASAIAAFPVIRVLSMMSPRRLLFLLSIDLNRYVRTGLGTEGTADATFGFFHVNNVVAASVVLGRIGQHILGTEGDAQPAAFTPLWINYYGSFWHVCAFCESVSMVCRSSSVLPDRWPSIDCLTSCLWRFVNVPRAAIAYVSDSHAPAAWL